MKITRHYTKAGRSPYEGIDFEKRTTHLDGKDGVILQHQEDIWFPVAWSQIATDIVAQKYFRRKGVDHHHPNSRYNSKYSKKWAIAHELLDGVVRECEYDLRQVIHRMVGCWTFWGDKHGYFDTKKDAQAYYDEMSYMLAMQMFAPNSPQWFNTGLHWAYGIEGVGQGHYFVDPDTKVLTRSVNAYEHPQPHACFILSVKDDLVNDGGIFDLFTREARIFKLGSGAGTNYSTLRGGNEPLSGGGKSSGLMSFLPVGDRGAGAIKSGGTTRRAARMAVLDIDHPDVEKFIDWKVDEERKVVALTAGSIQMKKFWDEIRADGAEVKAAIRSARKNGLPSAFIAQCLARLKQNDRSDDIKTYDTSWEGEGYQSVSGMNANNTVRVTDDFMNAVEKGKKWTLVNRTGGDAKTLPARDLMDRINHASYLCGDPGLQFDTTINDWHTSPK
jgi:ribonucleoside-diphosphate reductase alpha chain